MSTAFGRAPLHLPLLDAVPEDGDRRRRHLLDRAGAWRAAAVRFAISGDADGARAPKTGKPGYNAFQVYGRMAAERNHFNINLGDTIYSDSEIGGLPPALTVAAKWAKYRQNLGYAHLRNLRRGTGLYSHWDDHEFVNDFSVAEHGRALHRAGATAFADYAPVTYSAASGLYRTSAGGSTSSSSSSTSARFAP